MAQITADDLVYNISSSKNTVSAVMNGYDASAIQKTYLGTVNDMVDVPLLDIGGVPIFELKEQFAAMGVELQSPILKVFNDTKAPEDAPPYPLGARNDRVEVRWWLSLSVCSICDACEGMYSQHVLLRMCIESWRWTLNNPSQVFDPESQKLQGVFKMVEPVLEEGKIELEKRPGSDAWLLGGKKEQTMQELVKSLKRCRGDAC